ncbi:hypothetical protein [Actinoplanes sp. G11-F43]|uniref:hypothetical protein n=1 Tax=Actinoplanes sp. G11-F43 TaxID=3424130 RepID=UPI003D345DB5
MTVLDTCLGEIGNPGRRVADPLAPARGPAGLPAAGPQPLTRRGHCPVLLAG